MEALERKFRARAGTVRVVVVDDGRTLCRHVTDELVQLHLDQPRLRAELDTIARNLGGHARRHLGTLQDNEDVVEHHRVLELERRQPGQHLLEPLAVGLERRERLVRLRQHFVHRVELVARRPDVDRDCRALLGDRDHECAGLLRDAFCRAMTSARLVRRNRRVGHQLHVRVGELRQRRVDDDRPVHLRQLVEELRRKRDVEPDPAGEEKRELVRIADHDQRALARADDVVDALTQLGARRDALERGEQRGIAARVVLGRRAREPEGGGGLSLVHVLQFASSARELRLRAGSERRPHGKRR